MFMFLLELTKMSYLSELFFKRLSLNHVNGALDVSFKNYFYITIDITSCNKWNVVIAISVSFKMKNKSARNMLKNKRIETSETSKIISNFYLPWFLNLHALNFAIRSSWLRQPNVLEWSFTKKPNDLLLSKAHFHFSNKASRHCCVL